MRDGWNLNLWYFLIMASDNMSNNKLNEKFKPIIKFQTLRKGHGPNRHSYLGLWLRRKGLDQNKNDGKLKIIIHSKITNNEIKRKMKFSNFILKVNCQCICKCVWSLEHNPVWDVWRGCGTMRWDWEWHLCLTFSFLFWTCS